MSLEDLNLLREAAGSNEDMSNTHLGKREVSATRIRRHGDSDNRKPGKQISDKPTTTCSVLVSEERATGVTGNIVKLHISLLEEIIVYIFIFINIYF